MSTCFAFSISTRKTFAEQTTNSFEQRIFTPPQKVEVFGFNGSSPKDVVYLSEDCYAVINNESQNKSLWIFKDGEWKQCSKDDHGHIRYLSSTKFIVSSRNTLFVFDVEDETYSPITFGNGQLGASFFDVSGNNLVIKTDSGQVYCYKINQEGQIVSDETKLNLSATNDSYVCVNESGEVYYVSGNGLLNRHQADSPICDVMGVKAMTSYLGDLFFIANSDVYKLSSIDGQVTKLNKPTSDFELGNILAPVNLSIKNGNLLISDSQIGAVQEFKVEGDSLVWTGFAIAKNKTAFNRITDSAFDIERYGNLTAIINDQKIMVVNERADFDPYNQDFFLNISKNELGGVMPNGFALGNATLGLFKNTQIENVPSVSFGIYTINAREGEPNLLEFTLPAPATFAHDVCYQSGYYYVLSTASQNKLVIQKINERDGQVTQLKTLDPMTNPVFTVNVYGEPFVFDQDSQITKLSSDLKGNVFALKNDGKLYRFDYDRSNKSISQEPSVLPFPNDATIKSFAMTFDKTDVYYICNGQEFIYKSSSFSNVAIDGIEKGVNFLLSDLSARPEELRFYDANLTIQNGFYGDSVNAYVVNTNEQNFTFSSLICPELSSNSVWKNRFYAVVCYLENPGIYVLAGQDGIILADLNEQDLKAPSFSQLESNSSVFVTTDVNAYYLPIITKNGTYVLNDFARLEKGTQVSVIKGFNFLERNYYVAKFSRNDTITYGYIPVEFTTEILSEDRVFTPFTIKTATKVSVYSEETLTNVIHTLEDGDQIRVFANQNGVAKICYFYQDAWHLGYVNSNSIVQQSKNTIRNVLIILALTACVCGTVTFFVLRKRER